MTWKTDVEELEEGRVRRVSILSEAGTPPTHREAVELLRSDEGFRAHFIAVLAEAPYTAFFWETPPLTRASAARAFEFILADSPALARMHPDPMAFSEHFDDAGADNIATFRNLGGDALLVAPVAPEPPVASYPHLASFARTAPAALQHDFWRAVGESTAAHIAERPLWVSTSGLGIAWLHVRLDSRPKYYTFPPYKAAP